MQDLLYNTKYLKELQIQRYSNVVIMRFLCQIHAFLIKGILNYIPFNEILCVCIQINYIFLEN